MDLLTHLDLQLVADQGIAVMMGLALAATCGLRAFLPLLTITLLAITGHVDLGPGFQWMASPVTAVCFGTACVAETASDKIPLVDHFMDSIGVLVKPTAAAIAAASMVTGFDPLLALVLGLLTGGAAAEMVHVAKAKVRAASTVLTGATANPVLSVAEDGAAVAGVTLAALAPVLGGVAVVVGLMLMTAWWLRRRSRAAELAV